MINRLVAPLRIVVMTVLVASIASGCGLFNSAQREREQQNSEITSAADFGDVVTAEGVGANNEPVQVTNSFSSSQDYIYVVAEARRIEPGTSMFARWSRDGQPFEDSSELKADRLYENTYVEFHLENLQDRFEPGKYTVQLFVNGNPAEEAQFSVQ